MSKKIIINGESWCRNVTGIERVAIDTVTILDSLCNKNEIELVISKNVKTQPRFNNIRVVQLDYEITNFTLWTQFAFQKYVKKQKGIALDFTNTCPYFAPGIEYLHDIYFKLYSSDAKSKKDKLIQIYSNLMYRRIAKKAKTIIAVSEYTKQTIIDTYKIAPERIKVIYDGISPSYKQIKPDFSIFDSHPELKKDNFYFTLGSLSVRKNLKWIANHANLYPNELFAISGTMLKNVIPAELEILRNLKNVVFLGYLSDAQVKALMTNCKAFIFPSYFEGFGLPPLEALSCGAKIIISNKTCLPEIYQDCAYYIDPDVPNVDLDNLLQTKVASSKKLLEKFTVENTAKQLYEVIKEYL